MAKITSGHQSGTSKLIVDAVLSETSQIEVPLGDQIEQSTREIHIVELPATMDMSCLAKDIDRILSRFGSTALTTNTAVAENLREAKKAAESEERGKVSLFLQKAGSVALELATKVGADLAV